MPTNLFTHHGIVIHGEKVGRQIGFPTVNIDQMPSTEIPRGVYAGTCRIDDQTYNCAIYYGPRLIFGEEKDCFEAYLYDFDQDVYGKEITFEAVAFIRPPLPFTTLPDLKAQLEKDKVESARELGL